MIKAIFFDIDGTLVSFRTHRMSEEVKKALRTLQSKGVKLFISSGRAKYMMYNLEDFPFDGYITMNGALTLMDGKIIDAHPLPKDITEKVCDICEENDIACWTFTDSEVGLNHENDHQREVSAQLNFYPEGFCDMRKLSRENDIYEYTIYVTSEEEEKLLRHVLDRVDYARWHPYFSDIIPAGVTKSFGAEKVLEALGATKDECMAFGDGGNDLPLIEFAGTGVAMENATDDVKAVADYVTDSVDDDGVVAALRHFGLL